MSNRKNESTDLVKEFRATNTWDFSDVGEPEFGDDDSAFVPKDEFSLTNEETLYFLFS